MIRPEAPEVSVVMSCHNAGRWLQTASDSVLAQTSTDFEFILVDDGSSDNTWDIIQKYRSRDERVVPVAKEHSGLADSLNAGLMQSRGTWIARIDADDLWEPRRLEAQLRFVHRNRDVVLLGTNFVQIDANGGSVRRIRCASSHRRLLWNLEHLQRFFPHSSALFRRDVAQNAGCYNAWNRLSEDSDLWLRLAETGRIACLEPYLVKCRLHPEQVSRTTAAGLPQLIYGIAAIVCHFLRLKNFPDPSRGSDRIAWENLIGWIDKRVSDDGTLKHHRSWADARGAYFASRNRLLGAIRGGSRLLLSGDSRPLIEEKLFGLSLPKRLAEEWIDLHRVIPS